MFSVMARVTVNFNSRERTGAFWELNKDLMKGLVDKIYYFFLDGLHG